MAESIDATRWNEIFYGEGHMDVQRTNEIYKQRYGLQGTTAGYTNTTSQPATTANPALPGLSSYDPNAQVYTNPQGTASTPASGVAPAPTSAPMTTAPTAGPTGQPSANPQPAAGGVPPNAQTSTADLLKEFLESDPDLMLNMVANHFRDGGASSVFMQWFTNNFRSFWGRYLGYVAEQAYNGQIPTLSFVDWVMQFDTQGAYYAGGGSRQVASNASSSTWANYVSQANAA